jgi:hypothetical protein
MFYLGESTTSTLPIMGTALERENMMMGGREQVLSTSLVPGQYGYTLNVLRHLRKICKSNNLQLLLCV